MVYRMQENGEGNQRMAQDELRAEAVDHKDAYLEGIMNRPAPFSVPPIRTSTSVQPLWFSYLPLQQQSVIFLAMRGHDGKAKEITSKFILRAYRGTVLMAAKYGRILRFGEKADTFMSLDEFADWDHWVKLVDDYRENHDELSVHFYSHLMHGAQIVGYKHPDERFRARWEYFYLQSVSALHLNPETEEQMDKRLSDWGQQYWD